MVFVREKKILRRNKFKVMDLNTYTNSAANLAKMDLIIFVCTPPWSRLKILPPLQIQRIEWLYHLHRQKMVIPKEAWL